jgi:hypothetical protein
MVFALSFNLPTRTPYSQHHFCLPSTYPLIPNFVFPLTTTLNDLPTHWSARSAGILRIEDLDVTGAAAAAMAAEPGLVGNLMVDR